MVGLGGVWVEEVIGVSGFYNHQVEPYRVDSVWLLHKKHFHTTWSIK